MSEAKQFKETKRQSSLPRRGRFWRSGLSSLVAILIMTACSGNPSGTNPPATSGGEPSGTRESFETTEYYKSGGLDRINASTAYAEGYTGKGVTVALIGDGFDGDHPDIIGHEPEAYVIATDGVVREGHNDYGGTVLSLLAAPKNDKYIHGVAYDAKFINIETEAGLSPAVRLAAGLNADRPNVSADVIQIFGHLLSGLSDADDRVLSLQEAAQRDKLLVVPTLSETDAAVLADVVNSPEIGGRMIVAGALNTNNELYLGTQPAGDARDHYVVAPGSALTANRLSVRSGECRTLFWSYYWYCDPPTTTYYTIARGSDAAAAFVTGSAAIIKQAFPHLSAAQIAQILFSTATDLGAPGVDDIFGHGLINLAAAMQPIGSLTVPTASTVSGTSADLSTTSLDLGPAFGDALTDNVLLDQTVALDAFDRTYRVGLGTRVSGQYRGMNLKPLVARSSSSREVALPTLDGLSLRLAFGSNDPYAAERMSDADPMSFASVHDTDALPKKPALALSADLPLGGKLNLSSGMSPHGYFRLAGDADRDDRGISYFHDTAAVRMPHLSLIGAARGAVYSRGAGSDTDVALGWFESKDSGPDGGGGGGVAQSLVRHRFGDRATLAVGFGMLREDDSFLASRSEGAFGRVDGTQSYFTSILGSIDLGNRFTLLGSYTRARARLRTEGNGLLGDWSPVHADSASLGLTRRGLFASGDRAGFLVSQPLRVNRATATLTVPVGRDLQGNLIRKGDRVDVTPSGREIDLQLVYQRPVADGANVATYMFLRREPGHIAGAKPEVGVAAKVSVKF